MTDAAIIEDDPDLPPVTPEAPEVPPEAPAATPKADKTAKTGKGDASGKNTPKVVSSAPAKQPRFRIILEESDDIPPTGLFIGSNGRSYLLRPGEEVTVPAEVVSVLDDAVMSTPKTDANGNVLDYRNRLRFPYRLLGPA